MYCLHYTDIKKKYYSFFVSRKKKKERKRAREEVVENEISGNIFLIKINPNTLDLIKVVVYHIKSFV